MRRSAWLVLMLLVAAACGDGSSTTAATASGPAQVGGAVLSGVQIEVHENPG